MVVVREEFRIWWTLQSGCLGNILHYSRFMIFSNSFELFTKRDNLLFGSIFSTWFSCHLISKIASTGTGVFSDE